MAGGIKCAKYDYKLWEIFSEFLKIVLMRPQAKMQNGRRFSLKYTVLCVSWKFYVG
jgi:hypothetical protein